MHILYATLRMCYCEWPTERRTTLLLWLEEPFSVAGARRVSPAWVAAQCSLGCRAKWGWGGGTLYSFSEAGVVEGGD